MSEQKRMGTGTILVVTIVAFAVVTGLFYGLDHFIMNIQGLPLNLDLTPAS